MIALLMTSLAWSRDSKDEEIEALREAVAAYKASNAELEAAVVELQEAIVFKDGAIESYRNTIRSLHDLVAVKDERVAAEIAFREAAMERGDHLAAIVEAKKAKVGSVERVAWIGAVIAVGAVGVYGTVHGSPVIIQTGAGR